MCPCQTIGDASLFFAACQQKTSLLAIKQPVSLKNRINKCRQFLPRISILLLTRDIDILSVRPSVRKAPVLDENGLTYRQFFSPYRSPIILVLPASNIFTKFRRVTPCEGTKYRWGIKISRFSTNKSLYLANDTRYHHSYYGRRIGTRMRSTK